jgi:hypothetical protein
VPICAGRQTLYSCGGRADDSARPEGVEWGIVRDSLEVLKHVAGWLSSDESRVGVKPVPIGVLIDPAAVVTSGFEVTDRVA